MASGKSLQPTEYAKHKYNLTQPVDFDVAVNYAGALMAIAGADGELAEAEFQWYIDEQKLLMVEPEEYIETVRKLDWKNGNIEELLQGISYDFPLNFRRRGRHGRRAPVEAEAGPRRVRKGLQDARPGRCVHRRHRRGAGTVSAEPSAHRDPLRRAHRVRTLGGAAAA